MLSEKNNPDMRAAEDQNQRSNMISNVGQAIEGMFRARSQATGGQGTNAGYYDALRGQAGQRLGDKRSERRQALKKMMMARDMDRQGEQDQLKMEDRGIAAGERERRAGIDQERLGMDRERLELLKNRPQAPGAKNRYDVKIDPFGRAYKIDKWGGGLETLDAGTLGGEQAAAGEDAPMVPRKGESKAEFNKRVSMKYQEDKPRTAAEQKSMTFAERMVESEKIFNDLEKSGYDRSDYSSGVAATVVPEFAQSENLKKQEQAERNFVNALLREESGAAIAESEFESAAKQYFPRAGDSPDVIEQKRRNRKIVTDGFKRAARMGDDSGFDTQAPDESMQPEPPAQAPESQGMSEEDAQALQWAKDNPDTPQAQEIMKLLGR